MVTFYDHRGKEGSRTPAFPKNELQYKSFHEVTPLNYPVTAVAIDSKCISPAIHGRIEANHFLFRKFSIVMMPFLVCTWRDLYGVFSIP
jgi:hypothetical protein